MVGEQENSVQELLQAQILLDRLERISADSQWAHQASGIRASLAKRISRKEIGGEKFRQLIEHGFSILEKAAAEYPEE